MAKNSSAPQKIMDCEVCGRSFIPASTTECAPVDNGRWVCSPYCEKEMENSGVVREDDLETRSIMYDPSTGMLTIDSLTEVANVSDKTILDKAREVLNQEYGSSWREEYWNKKHNTEIAIAKFANDGSLWDVSLQ